MQNTKHTFRKVLASLLAVLLLVVGTASASFAAEAAAAETAATSRQLVFVGDSRTCYLHSTQKGYYLPDTFLVDDTGIWSATYGCQFSWMQTVLVPRIELFLNSNSSVVFWMGFNDIMGGNSNAKTYADYYNSKTAEWKSKGVKVYVINVGPKGSNKSINTIFAADNKKIRKFNKTLKNNLSGDITYLDVYSAISGSFSTPDDTHYSDNTNKRIYNWILRHVK